MPIARSFRYNAFMLYAALDDIPNIFNRNGFWGLGKSIVRFKRDDYLPGQTSLRDEVLASVQSQLGRRPTGRVCILSNPRMLGVLSNPLTLFYCFDDSAATRLSAVVLEVTNTPWGERQRYVLSCDPGVRCQRIRFDKRMHVSPFMPMQQTYELSLSIPDERLQVHLRNIEDDKTVFDATLALRRRAISTRQKCMVLIEYPWMSLKTVLAIYWQALKIFLAGVPFYSHPNKGNKS